MHTKQMDKKKEKAVWTQQGEFLFDILLSKPEFKHQQSWILIYRLSSLWREQKRNKPSRLPYPLRVIALCMWYIFFSHHIILYFHWSRKYPQSKRIQNINICFSNDNWFQSSQRLFLKSYWQRLLGIVNLGKHLHSAKETKKIT